MFHKSINELKDINEFTFKTTLGMVINIKTSKILRTPNNLPLIQYAAAINISIVEIEKIIHKLNILFIYLIFSK